jgi:hypothetical protein
MEVAMKYTVIDTQPGMNYDPGDEVLGTVEASSPKEAKLHALKAVGLADLVSLAITYPADFEEYVLKYLDAVPS